MAKHKNEDIANSGASNSAAENRLAAVRDLIFGENMQQYDKDFTEVSNQISALKEDTDKNLVNLASSLENKIEKLQKSNEMAMQKMIETFEKKMTQLDEGKADRKKLGKALEKIATMLQG